MPKFRNFQTNFSGGLLSEGMLGRLDLAQYEEGCKQLDNWWPKVTGGMRRRPGSLYKSTVNVNSNRIESFIFSETQVYQVVFSPFNIKIYNDEGATLVEEIGNFYSSTQIRELSITQKADVMFVAHTSFRTRVLTRTGATSFTWLEYDFEGLPPFDTYPKRMPFIKFADQRVTIKPSSFAKDDLCTLVASSPVFFDGLISHAIRYRGKQIFINGFNNSTTITGIILEELDRGTKLTFNNAIDSPHDFLIDELIVGRDSGTKAQVIETDDNFIIVALIAGKFPTSLEEVEGLTSGNIAKVTSVILQSPPEHADWQEEAFSTFRGWPGIVEFHSQRLWFGGSSSLPAHIFGSRVAAFFNFDAGDAFPADSIQVGISGNQINKVTDIVSSRHLQVFTDVAEFYAPQSEDRPLEPLTFDLIQQTRYGSKRTVGAKVFDESTIFVQAQGSAIREFIWQASLKGYSSDAISLIAEEHLHGITEIEILYGGYDRPEQLAFFINGDGNIIWYHSARAENIRTWGRWTTQGKYISLTVIQDKLYALVERTIDGEEVTYLEVFDLDITIDAAIQVTNNDVEKSSWTAVHPSLKNTEIDVVSSVNGTGVPHSADFYLGDFTLNSAGDLDISPIEIDNVTVGLSFTQILEPMPIEVKDQNGVTGGMPKRIVSADLYMASTLAAELNGILITTFRSENDLTEKPESITGLRKFYLLGYSERPTVLIKNRIPLPFEILSLGTEVEY